MLEVIGHVGGVYGLTGEGGEHQAGIDPGQAGGDALVALPVRRARSTATVSASRVTMSRLLSPEASQASRHPPEPPLSRSPETISMAALHTRSRSMIHAAICGSIQPSAP
jgi:hypothetical protein